VRPNVRSFGAVRARLAAVLRLLIGLIAGFAYVSMSSAAVAQARTISRANAKAAPASGGAGDSFHFVIRDPEERAPPADYEESERPRPWWAAGADRGSHRRRPGTSGTGRAFEPGTNQ